MTSEPGRGPGPPARLTLLLAGLLVVLLPAAARLETSALRFGVFPRQTPRKLAEMFAPVARYLSQEARVRVVFETATTFAVFQERVDRGDYDLAHLSPLQYVRARARAGYTVIARYDELLTGLLIVRRDGEVRRLEDLRGRTLALGDPGSLAGNLLPRWYLRRHGIDADREVRLKVLGQSLEAPALAVYSREADAGAVAPSVFRTLDEDLRGELAVLAETEGLASDPFAVHPRVPARVVAALRSALVSLHLHDRGRRLLEALGYHRVVPADDADYEPVRAFAREMGLVR